MHLLLLGIIFRDEVPCQFRQPFSFHSLTGAMPARTTKTMETSTRAKGNDKEDESYLMFSHDSQEKDLGRP